MERNQRIIILIKVLSFREKKNITEQLSKTMAAVVTQNISWKLLKSDILLPLKIANLNVKSFSSGLVFSISKNPMQVFDITPIHCLAKKVGQSIFDLFLLGNLGYINLAFNRIKNGLCMLNAKSEDIFHFFVPSLR